MRLLIVFAVFWLISVPASAVDYRWTVGFAQGTTEAIIRNKDGASLNIYCPAGQIDTTPGMFLTSDKVRPRPQEQIIVQIVIDDENHSFSLREAHFKASGRAGLNALYSLVEAIVKSRSKSFVVEYPKFGSSERFSLLGAKKALESAGEFLRGCSD
ncbi:MAG: hypothetical protein AB7T86_03280 [Xanthobacteraceae bacterium]|uniref:hypothetical protein n=1 Tax=Pseudolabrys sp. TaxID=1960880 RepID=UPI003D14B779